MTATATPPTEKALADAVTRMGALLEGAEGLKAKIAAIEPVVEKIKDFDGRKLVEEMEKNKAAIEQVTRAIRTAKTPGRITGLEDYADRFSVVRLMTAVRTGDWSKAQFEKSVIDEYRTKLQQIGDDTSGGYFVPDQVIADVVGALYATSVFVNLDGGGQTRVQVVDGLVGGTVTIPKFDGGTIAYWMGESDEATASTVKTGLLTMNRKRVGVLTQLTESMMRSGGYGFENLLRQDMVMALAMEIDRAIAYGTGGDHQPRGITGMTGVKVWDAGGAGGTYLHTLATAKAIANWAGAVLTFDGLDGMKLALEEDKVVPDSSFSIISCPRFFTQLKQLKVDNYNGQTTNQPYLIGIPMLPDSRLRELIGEFAKSVQIPSNALPGASIGGTTTSTDEKHTDVFMGNFRNVLLGRWGSIQIADDGGRGADFKRGITNMLISTYVDVGARQERALIFSPNAKVRA